LLLTVTGECFRPNTKLYAFFDGTPISAYITPSAESYTTDTTILEGSPLISDIQGKIEATFRIPEYRFAGQEKQPKFKTGELEFRLTASEENVKAPAPSTVGQANYTAKGMMNTTQQTIQSTRNATIVTNSVTQTNSVTSDPLAQTFLISEKGGCFIPSVDLFLHK